MSKIVTDSQYYEDIAEAIRERKGITDQYKPEDMSWAIKSLPVVQEVGSYIALTPSSPTADTFTLRTDNEPLRYVSHKILNIETYTNHQGDIRDQLYKKNSLMRYHYNSQLSYAFATLYESGYPTDDSWGTTIRLPPPIFETDYTNNVVTVTLNLGDLGYSAFSLNTDNYNTSYDYYNIYATCICY